MNENLDLTKILDGCPEGAKFYSPMMGNVKFNSIVGKFIYVVTMYGNLEVIEKTGNYKKYNGECMLLPSKDQRDWSKFVRFWDKPKVRKFDPKTFQPFDKVLARCKKSHWMPTLFGFFIDKNNEDPLTPFTDERVVCVDVGYHECVPYNDDTKHLVGTMEEAPDFYKWWEE